MKELELTPLIEGQLRFRNTIFSADNARKRKLFKAQNSINNVEIFYAVKANSHPSILETLRDLGSSFDVASKGKL